MPRENNMLDTMIRLAVSDGRRKADGNDTPDGKTMRNYLAGVLVASLPCLGIASYYFGRRVWVMVAVAAVCGVAVEAVFGHIRGKPVSGGAVAYSCLLVLLLPPDIPLWMVGIGSAFGIFFAKEVFGGTGSHIFHPVLVSKAFLMFSYPQTLLKSSYFGSMTGFVSAELDMVDPCAPIICSGAILLGGAIMVLAKYDNLRVMTGILFGGICIGIGIRMSGYLPYNTVVELISSDGFLLGACLLACEPACSPRDPEARWFYGMLIGVMAVVMRSFSTYTEGMMSAILVANVFSPTIDMLTRVSLGRKNEK